MLSFTEINRRALLKIGALSLFGSSAIASSKTATIPSKSCIFLHLQGGPSHHDLWDPKPLAVPEIRGAFQAIQTAVPEIQFGELLAGSAKVADHLCVVRSMTHRFTNHIAGTYITLTGSTNQQDRDREAHGDDFPGPGAVLNALQTERSDVPRAVSLPNWLSIPGPSNRMPGQYGGFLGSVHDPFLVEGDPGAKDYRPLSLTMPEGVSSDRLKSRLNLSRQLEVKAKLLEEELDQQFNHLQRSAYDLVVDGKIRKALDLSQEKETLRDRYGRNRFGQSLLLARRLVEAGVQFIGFNEFNQKWDTHGGLEGRYKQIVPEMDQAFSALVEDLAERGMLENTLVVNTGEFGRTPTINGNAGRDHWPNVYSTVLAGGGIRGGQIVGASDSKGAEVLDNPISPADLLATVWHQLGIDPHTELRDRLNRPLQLSEGSVLRELIGEQS
ncbi:DUF1501 domain-containing protein [Planctomicrobium sp.]|jgi:hypothetical protein|nr:DUF1501 domain-containing protein [Planctomicrobium sp.]MBT5018156.1 DUF1501 domain-containing protein [Planctomicrobium sp.]MDB4439440.1 DUF1501 domain-containing protein [Planctomicrobium sp.]MDB4733055.1 DUF1501 domain-containing protein [Planctomicrobium sp.]MDB4743721.1 DUF1501 domain-containing protein [Planctomicrobium sp.]